jgi:hypothetical protein
MAVVLKEIVVLMAVVLKEIVVLRKAVALRATDCQQTTVVRSATDVL